MVLGRAPTTINHLTMPLGNYNSPSDDSELFVQAKLPHDQFMAEPKNTVFGYPHSAEIHWMAFWKGGYTSLKLLLYLLMGRWTPMLNCSHNLSSNKPSSFQLIHFLPNFCSGFAAIIIMQTVQWSNSLNPAWKRYIIHSYIIGIENYISIYIYMYIYIWYTHHLFQ